MDRVDGVKIAELTQKVRQYAQKTSNVVPIKKTVSKEDLNTRLKRLINMHEVSEAYDTCDQRVRVESQDHKIIYSV